MNGDFFDNFNDAIKNNKIVRLLFYLFIIGIAVYFCFFSNVNSSSLEESNIKKITLPDTYDYTLIVNMDDTVVKYSGTKNNTENIFKKTKDEIDTDYAIVSDNTFYQVVNDEYELVSIDDIYDILPYKYLNIDSINNYLSLAIKEDDVYKVYINKIILNSENEDYISIQVDDNKIQIDYSSLLKELNYEIEKCLVTFEYVGKE